MPPSSSSNPRAFTIVELLVSVTIVATLLALLLPALGRVRDETKATLCLSNLRSLGLTTQTAMNTRGGLLPFALPHAEPDAALGREAFENVFAEGEHSEVLLCPSDPALAGAASDSAETSYTYWPGELMQVAADVGRPNVIRTVTQVYETRPGPIPVFSDTESWHASPPRRQAVFFGDWSASPFVESEGPFGE